jgi:hypothetical protein
LIFLGRFFGKSFVVVLRCHGSNFVIFGGRLIEFCLLPFSLSKAEILLRAFLREKTRSIQTFSPETPETPGKSAEYLDFFSGNPGDSGKKCRDSGLSSEVYLGLFDCVSALFLSLL